MRPYHLNISGRCAAASLKPATPNLSIGLVEMIGGQNARRGDGLATPHVRWPLFEARHFDLAVRFAHWVSVNLKPYENDEGGTERRRA